MPCFLLRKVLATALRPVFPAALALAVACLADDDTIAQETLTVGDEAPAAETEAYRVEFVGIDNSRLETLFQRSSQLVALRADPPASRTLLIRRAERDLDRLDEVLRSEGFYGGRLAYRIDEEADPVVVVVEVILGPEYLLRRFAVTTLNEQGGSGPNPPSLDAIGVRLDQRARAEGIVAAESRVLGRLAEGGYPLAQVADRTVTVDHRDASVAVDLTVASGPQVRFGAVTFEGLQSVREDYVRGLIRWSEGQRWQQDKVDGFRRKLLRTGLFSAVATERGEVPDAAGRLPLVVRVVEGEHRSIGLGGEFSTSEGPAANVSWEHRNLFGRNEDLSLSLGVGEIRQEAKVQFLRPDFRAEDQDLVLTGNVLRINSEAYNELGASASAGVRIPLSSNWRLSTALSGEYSLIEDEEEPGSQASRLAGLPTALSYDGSDDRLDPTSGTRLTLASTPYTGLFNGPVTFIVNEVTGSGYLEVFRQRRLVLAGRTKLGSLVGEDTADIPANKRFYAGGGGSIRGYKFQKVGPLNDNRDPIGGRSLFEVGAELRTRVWGNFSVIPFIEGGNVFEASYPDFSDAPRWGAGVGLGYRTAIGPVRLDFAFPLNRRKDIDDTFQFYVALGQPF